jgi:3-hydroxyacyl-CoA dehydrogenase
MVKNSPQAKNLPAPVQAIEAIRQGTLLPFERALALEREQFLNLMWTPESRALRHLFSAQRNTTRVADLDKDTPTRNIQHVGIVGSGTMGGGIAMNFLMAGMTVTLLDTSQEAVEKGVKTLTKNFEDRVKKGKLKAEKLQAMLAALKTTLSYEDFKDCDLIIEAVFEDMGVKEKVFKQLDACAKEGAILATNTSTLDVNTIASFTDRPQDVVGLHFFSPAHVMKLLEVVRARETSKVVLASALAVAKKIKKIAVVSGVCDGFIGNRMIEQYSRQAGFLLE